MRHATTHHITLLFAVALSGCSSHGDTSAATKPLSQESSSTGVGDSCIPDDESRPDFSGYAENEVNIESESPSCQTGVCLVNHFRGRVSCPDGQPADSL